MMMMKTTTTLFTIFLSLVVSSLAYSKYPQPYPGQSYPRPKYYAPVEPKKGKCTKNIKCACKTKYIFAEEPVTFTDHILLAAQKGCWLATAADADELEKIKEVALTGVNLGLGSRYTYIGAHATINGNNEDASAFSWIDGCDDFFDIFSGEQPVNRQYARDGGNYDPGLGGPEGMLTLARDDTVVGIGIRAGLQRLRQNDESGTIDQSEPALEVGAVYSIHPYRREAAVYECCVKSKKSAY